MVSKKLPNLSIFVFTCYVYLHLFIYTDFICGWQNEKTKFLEAYKSEKKVIENFFDDVSAISFHDSQIIALRS